MYKKYAVIVLILIGLWLIYLKVNDTNDLDLRGKIIEDFGTDVSWSKPVAKINNHAFVFVLKDDGEIHLVHYLKKWIGWSENDDSMGNFRENKPQDSYQNSIPIGNGVVFVFGIAPMNTESVIINGLKASLIRDDEIDFEGKKSKLWYRFIDGDQKNLKIEYRENPISK